MCTHGGLSNLAQMALFDIEETSRILQFASLSFDASVWEMAMAWANGAALYLAPRAALLPGRPLLETLSRHRISHVLLAPSLLPACEECGLAFAATTLVLGGETVPVELANRWASRVNLYNAYGPTEASVCATTWRFPPRSSVVAVGRPLPNVRIYILDASLRPAPEGAPGDIYVGGAGVSRGYRNLPQLTSERFLKIRSRRTRTRGCTRRETSAAGCRMAPWSIWVAATIR